MTQPTISPHHKKGSPAIAVVPSLLGHCAVQAGGLLGLEFQPITVEVASRRGPSLFQLAGLAETSVREARIRINSALSHLGITLDEFALTVNLAPANVRKSGSGLDLSIAVAILGAVEHIDSKATNDAVFLGEVALDGAIRAIPGILPLLDGARKNGIRNAYVPEPNAREAAQIHGMAIHAVRNLHSLVSHLQGETYLEPLKNVTFRPSQRRDADLSEVRGQLAAKRALIVSAAGHHNLLLVGPPGSGKSLLARRLTGLLPPLDAKQALETTAIHSIAGVLNSARGIIDVPPFRAPHHTVSEPGLIGGGSIPRPGELSLAHHGVLFLDEMPEFRRGALESLRQPLEDHEVHIVRARMRTRFPAHPLLVGAMNPCPCGNWGNPKTPCRCKPEARLRYLARISGPLLDRIDLHVLVPPVDLRAWTTKSGRAPALSSSEARKMVNRAREAQSIRYRSGDVSSGKNSLLGLQELERVADPTPEGKRLLEAAIDKNLLSARGYVRVLRVARTLADLEGTERPQVEHVGEALRYRLPDLSSIS